MPCLGIGRWALIALRKNFRFLPMALRMAAGLSALVLYPFPLLNPCSRHIVLFSPTTVQARSCLRAFAHVVPSASNALPPGICTVPVVGST